MDCYVALSFALVLGMIAGGIMGYLDGMHAERKRHQ